MVVRTKKSSTGDIAGKSQSREQLRVIKAHPKLLMDTIKRQAGTLAKAIVEGYMNAVDAKATEFRVEIKSKEIILRDDGNGITSQESIEKFFETFGFPHDESEGKVYAQFRMGRGQMFAFGYNIWRTGSFEMHVDVDRNGLDYRLLSGLPEHAGCEIRIKLYRELTHSDEAELRRDIANWCAFGPIQMYVDGDLISQDVMRSKWDHITDEAYVRFDNSSSLDIYNLGVFTMSKPKYSVGVGGVVVTKKQLRVNFARNDVMSDCQVWAPIKSLIRKAADADAGRTRKQTLGSSTATYLRRQLADSVLAKRWNPSDTRYLQTQEWRELLLFVLSDGSRRSLETLVKSSTPFVWTVAEPGNIQADRLIQTKVATVFSKVTLDELGVKTTQELQKFLHTLVCLSNAATGRRRESDQAEYVLGGKAISHVDLKKLAENIPDESEILDVKKFTDRQKFWADVVQLIQTSAGVAARRMESAGKLPEELHFIKSAVRRRTVLGTSVCNNGWTDGRTYVAIAVQYLNECRITLDGLSAVTGLLFHEWCHDESDAASHVHGIEFYKAYHDLERRLKGLTLQIAISALLGAKKYRDRLTVKQIRDLTYRK